MNPGRGRAFQRQSPPVPAQTVASEFSRSNSGRVGRAIRILTDLRFSSRTGQRGARWRRSARIRFRHPGDGLLVSCQLLAVSALAAAALTRRSATTSPARDAPVRQREANQIYDNSYYRVYEPSQKSQF
jgi:hypothetical protein